MATKTYQSAVVLIPAEDVHQPIQDIRRQHDQQIHRWMPHITLLYPFWREESFALASEKLVEACCHVAPFEVTLASFGAFRHRRHNTLWLAPQPRSPLAALQATLQATFPDCAEQSRFPGGFNPHLSVGQFRSVAELTETRARLEAGWQPLRFLVTRVALIARASGGPFAVVHWFALGGERQCRPPAPKNGHGGNATA
jgi:poly(A) polymerase